MFRYWPGSVHPRFKQPLGHRLALEARRIAYGLANATTRGPQIKSVRSLGKDPKNGSYLIKTNEIYELQFTSVGSGLQVNSHSSVAFVAVLNDTSLMPMTVMPTGLTKDSLHLYINLGGTGRVKGAKHVLASQTWVVRPMFCMALNI